MWIAKRPHGMTGPGVIGRFVLRWSICAVALNAPRWPGRASPPSCTVLTCVEKPTMRLMWISCWCTLVLSSAGRTHCRWSF